MDGVILKLSEVPMAYPKVESWPIIYSVRESKSQDV